jgi:2-polyprenyl-3-methyl-5-hydroxy-6-metoxy-1,4-benzoquinol methylase
MSSVKENVNVFNSDIESNQGYKYTTNARFSSIVANKRLTEVTLANIPAGVKTVIDIGCGDGTYTNELFQARKDLVFEGTDPAAKAVAHANRQYQGIQFFTSNILEQESFSGKHYDIAVIRGVLHHLSDQQKAIQNTASLADNMLIIEPNGNNPVLKYIEKHSAYHIEHEEQSFTTRQLRHWCEASGWKVIKVQHVGFVPYFFSTPLSKIIYFFQPLLEKIPVLRYYLGAQIVILCSKK